MAIVNAAFPILEGKTEAWQAWADTLIPGGADRAAWEDQLNRYGITRHFVSLQKTPHGDSIIVFFEGNNPGAMLAGLAASDNEYDKAFARHIMEIHGVDVRMLPPGPPAEVKLEFGA